MTDRGTNGKFVKGNKASPGRPKRATEQEYLDVLYEVAAIEKWRLILEAQMKRAQRGDILAFNAIANRILPILERREHAGEGGGAIKIQIIDATDERNND